MKEKIEEIQSLKRWLYVAPETKIAATQITQLMMDLFETRKGFMVLAEFERSNSRYYYYDHGSKPWPFSCFDRGKRKAWPYLETFRVSDEKQTAFIWGLSSFHANGYVREHALKYMMKAPNRWHLIFATLRLQDWVEPVAQRAPELFEAAAAQSCLEDWSQLAPVLKAMRHRKNGENIYTKIISIFSDHVSEEIRIAALPKGGTDFRAMIWDSLSARLSALPTAWEAFGYETNPVTARRVFAQIARHQTDEVFFTSALKHPLMSVRRLTLEHMDRRESPSLRRAAEKLAVDRSAGVRERASWVLKNRFDAAVHDLIRQNDFDPLKEGASAGHCLAWLETADAPEAEYVKTILQNTDKAKIRACAMNAYARLYAGTDKGSEETLLWALTQDGKTRGEAMRLVKMGWVGGIAGQIWGLSKVETSSKRRIFLMKLAARAHRRQSLLPALEAMSTGHTDIEYAAQELVRRYLRMPALKTLAADDVKAGRISFEKIKKGPNRLMREIDFYLK